MTIAALVNYNDKLFALKVDESAEDMPMEFHKYDPSQLREPVEYPFIASENLFAGFYRATSERDGLPFHVEPVMIESEDGMRIPVLALLPLPKVKIVPKVII